MSASGFDATTFAESVDNSVDLIKQLIESYPDEAEQYLNEARQALAEHNTETLRHALHSFKAIAGNFRASTLFDRSAELEKRAVAGLINGMDSEIQELETLSDSFRSELELYRKSL